jgi:hypothetical protein
MSVTMFSGWGVGRLALLDVMATFHVPYTLASELTSFELVEALNMWSGGREEEKERDIPHPLPPSPPPQKFISVKYTPKFI